jgi:hypothetical protein
MKFEYKYYELCNSLREWVIKKIKYLKPKKIVYCLVLGHNGKRILGVFTSKDKAIKEGYKYLGKHSYKGKDVYLMYSVLNGIRDDLK